MEIPKPSANLLYTCRGVACVDRGSTPHPVSCIERGQTPMWWGAPLYKPQCRPNFPWSSPSPV